MKPNVAIIQIDMRAHKYATLQLQLQYNLQCKFIKKTVLEDEQAPTVLLCFNANASREC